MEEKNNKEEINEISKEKESKVILTEEELDKIFEEDREWIYQMNKQLEKYRRERDKKLAKMTKEERIQYLEDTYKEVNEAAQGKFKSIKTIMPNKED